MCTVDTGSSLRVLHLQGVEVLTGWKHLCVHMLLGLVCKAVQIAVRQRGTHRAQYPARSATAACERSEFECMRWVSVSAGCTADADLADTSCNRNATTALSGLVERAQPWLWQLW
jgi:hypothetical protein